MAVIKPDFKHERIIYIFRRLVKFGKHVMNISIIQEQAVKRILDDMKNEKMAECKAEELYGDIIHLPHYEPKRHKRMDLYKRAAQFAPFAALTGYGDSIDEAARYTDERMDLSEDENSRMDRLITILQAEMDKAPEICVTHFVPDENKTGGSYIVTEGRVKKIDPTDRSLVMYGGKKIRLEHIIDMSGEIFM